VLAHSKTVSSHRLLASAVLVSTLACSGNGVTQRPGTASEPTIADQGRPHSRQWSEPGAHGAEAEVYQTWVRYLQSKAPYYSMGAWKPSPLWSASEQQRWPVYDLAGFYLPDSAAPEVLEVQRTVGGEYRIVNIFRSPNDNNMMRSRSITVTVFAQRAGKGWVLGNALPRLTRSWRREKVGQINYIMEPGYSFDSGRAQRAATFVDSLAAAFGVPRLEQLDYYLTSSVDQVYRILGLQVDTVWGPGGGVAQPRDRQLFSGTPAVGEDYRHELTHIVLLPLWTPRTSVLAPEGVATWLGGTAGMDLRTASRGLATFLTDHPEVTLDSMMARRFPAAQFYPAAGVFTLMVFERGGTDAVKGLFTAGADAPSLRAAMERLFNLPWASIADEWRRRVLAFGSGPPN